MSGRVTIRLPARRGGRRGRAKGAAGAPGADAAPAPTTARIPRVARVLALAHDWQGLIRSGAVRDQADLARLVGVSRARVTQVMRVLDLTPDIQEAGVRSQGYGVRGTESGQFSWMCGTGSAVGTSQWCTASELR